MTTGPSKYRVPKLPPVVSRLRLIERLQADPGHRLILVIGQAAQGKTTLVADFLATQDVPAAWLHLDRKDGDSADFYHDLVCALSHALPQSPLENYIEQAHIAMGASEASVRYEALLGSIWQRLPPDIHIVLDGLEQLPVKAPSWGLIQRVADLTADRGRILALSRQMPRLKLQQQVMQRAILTLDNTELAFTPEEISAYFEVVHDFRPAIACADSIQKATGGWAGGLVLVSQALSRQPRSGWDSFLIKQLPVSLADDAWRYFAEEIFDALPETVQNLLVKAALLDVIDPSILDGLIEEQRATSVLDDLVRRNLFIQVVYDRKQRPLYRLNHLFQNFLKNRFRSGFSAAEQHQTFEQLALLYKNRHQAEIAVDYYLAAKNFDAAAACIKKAGIDLVIRGHFADLGKAIAALPANQTKTDPWLFLLLTLTRRIKGGARNIEDLKTVMSAFKRLGDTRGQLMALAYLIEAQVFAGQDPAECRSSIARAEALLELQNETPYYSYARALLWLQTGLAYIASGLDLTRGVAACQNAYLLAYRINNPRLVTNANIVAVLGLTLRGDFERADETLEKIAAHSDTDAYTEYHTLRGLVNAELAMHRGDLISARRHLKPLAGEIETFGLLFLYPAYLDTTGFIQIYTGQFEAARDTSRHLLYISHLSGNTNYEGLSHRLNALRHYFQGNHYNAGKAARNALALLPHNKQPTLHWMRTQQLTGLIQLHLKQYTRAAKSLKAARRYYTATSNFLSLSETCLALGLLSHLDDNREKAADHLHQGFALAAEHQYEHYVILSPADLRECCLLAGQYFGSSTLAWPDHLLRVRFQQPPEPAATLMGTETTPSSRDSAKPAVTSSTSNKPPCLEILTLGRFQVLRNSRVPIGEKQWGGNRTKLLLKSIIVHGLQEIPKEIIIEDLWPESNPGSAIQNFKVTLHRLRKCLEPDLKKHHRSAYIHLKGNRVSLDTNRCRIDVQEFLRCCKDIKRAALAKETRAILQLGQKAMELYQGDFLPEDPYASWAEMKRLALKDEYLAALMAMADIYIETEQFETAIQCCQLAIAADACLENANGKLMRIYVRQGRRNDAVKLYRQLETALEQDLGVKPDPAITALYQQIYNGSLPKAPATGPTTS